MTIWACNACSYENSNKHYKCLICLTPKPSSKRRQSGVQKYEPEVSKVKPEVKSNAKPEVVRQTKSEEKSRNILLSQESDIQEGHVLLRIPSQQSLDEKPQADRKSNRKSDYKQDVNKKDSKLEWKNYLLSDEEKSKVQKGNFH